MGRSWSSRSATVMKMTVSPCSMQWLAAQAVGADPGVRRQDAEGQLLPAHFQAEHSGDRAVWGRAYGQVQGEGAFSGGGTRSQDDQARAVHPSRNSSSSGYPVSSEGPGRGSGSSNAARSSRYSS